MKRRLLAVILVVAMLSAAASALADSHIFDEDTFYHGDLKNSNPHDTNVRVYDDVFVHVIGDIISDYDPSIKPPHYFSHSAVRLGPGSYLNVSGSIINDFINLPLMYTTLSGCIVSVNDADLTVTGDITLNNVADGNSIAPILFIHPESSSFMRDVRIGGLNGKILNHNGSSEMDGILAAIANSSIGLNIDVAEDVRLDAASDGDAVVNGVSLLSSMPLLPDTEGANINIGGRILVKAESLKDGKASAGGFSIGEEQLPASGKIDASVGTGVTVQSRANNNAVSRGIDIFSAADAATSEISVNVTGDVSSFADSEHGDAEVNGVTVDGVNTAVTLGGDDSNWNLPIFAPQRVLLTAIAEALEGSASATAVKIDGSSILKGLPDILSSAEGNYAYAFGADAGNDSELELGDLDVVANGVANAIAMGIDAGNAADVLAGDISVEANGNFANATGVYTVGSPVKAWDITVSSNMPAASSAGLGGSTGIIANGGANVNAGNLKVTSANGYSKAILAEDDNTEVTVKDILAAGSNDMTTPYLSAMNGAKITADNVTLSDGTAMKVDNRSKIIVNGLIKPERLASSSVSRAANALPDAGTLIHMLIDGGTPAAGYAADIDAAVVMDGKLIYAEGEADIATEDELLEHMPSVHIKYLLSLDSLLSLIDGSVKGVPISSDTAGKIFQNNLEVENPGMLFAWEDGDHYTIDYVDTSKLTQIPGYDIYAVGTGEDVAFHVDLDKGYAVTSIETGSDAYAVEDDEDNWYFIKIPAENGVYITVKVSKTVNAALWEYYFYGMDPETKERLYWICTKVDDGKAKLISINGFEKTPKNFIEEYFSGEEKENIKSDGYYLEPELSEKIFADGLEHPIIDVDLFYIGY